MTTAPQGTVIAALERCTHLLRALLRHKLPLGRVLELGAAHGGFVSLLRQAGFDVIGLELSPAIVDLARRTFEVLMLQGTLEEQDLPPESSDVIALFDVLEHLTDSVGTHSASASACCGPAGWSTRRSHSKIRPGPGTASRPEVLSSPVHSVGGLCYPKMYS